MQPASCCVTLTFESDPVTVERETPRKFIKSLRNAGHKIKYFGAGEYGEKLGRPHYHLCLFGIDFAHDRYHWRTKKGVRYYRSPTLEKHWEHGNCEIGLLTPKAANYTAQYCLKKMYGTAADSHYVRFVNGVETTVSAELTLSSNGIGRTWIAEYYPEVYATDSIVMEGRQFSVPRYYDKYIQKNHPDIWDEIRSQRMEYALNKPVTTWQDDLNAEKARDGKYKNATRTLGTV